MTARVPSPPEPLSPDRALDGFECGETSLDDWLKRRALKNQASGASRCFVVCNGDAVIGYYGLSAGGIHQEAAPKPMRHNMPDPLPVLLLGRLAIDRRRHNEGLGRALLRDAMPRSVHVASTPACSPYWFMPSPSRPSGSTCRVALWYRHCNQRRS
jgi:hypothetical protein